MDKNLSVKLGICVSYYNDVNCLKRLLKSIFPLPPKYSGHDAGGTNHSVVFIAVDGRYRGYDDSKPDTKEFRRSTDGSYELIESIRNSGQHFKRYIINTAAPITANEREKRQSYVDIATMQGCDFIIIIDSDEWFERIKWRELFKELSDIKRDEWNYAKGSIYPISMKDIFEEKNRQEPQIQNRPRLWCDPSHIKYGDRHWQFVTVMDDGQERKPYRPRSLPSDIIQIAHDPFSCRSKERLELQHDYEGKLESLESGRM